MAQKEAIKKFVLHDRHGREIDFSSFAVVGDVEVNLGDGIGEPTAESTYEGGKLTINIDNIKGDGIASIEQTPSTEDEGINIVTITCESGSTYQLQIRNGSKGSRGNGIASIIEETSLEDGGINTITITDDDGYAYIIHTRNGQTGRPGADFQPIEDISGLSIAHITGDDPTKVMSQKGVTDAVENAENYMEVIETSGLDTFDYYIYQDKWYVGSTSNNCYMIPAKPGETYKFTFNGSGTRAHVIFLASNAMVNGATPDYANGYMDSFTGTVILTAPEATRYMYVRKTSVGNNVVPVAVKMSSVKSELAACKDILLSLPDDVNAVKDSIILSRQVDLKALLFPPREEGFVYLSTISPFEWANRMESGVWVEGQIVDVSKYRGMPITITFEKLRAAFLTDNNCPWPVPLQENVVKPNFCAGTTFIRNDVGTETTTELVVPNDAKYLYVMLRNGAGSMGIKAITVGSDQDMGESLQDNLHTSNKSNLVGAINSLVDDDRVTSEYEITLQAGMFNTSNGNPYYAITNQNIFSNAINRRYLKVKPTDAINSVTYDSEAEDLTALYYNGLFQYLGFTVNGVSIPKAARYVRFMLSKKDGIYAYDERVRIIKLNLSYSGEIVTTADGGLNQYDGSLPAYRGLMYEVQEPLDCDDGIDESEFVGSERRAINAGYIYLPRCYQHEGKPCKLIIFGHGTEGFTFNQTQVASEKWNYIFQYLMDMGYAVADCSTFTNLWTNGAYGAQTTQTMHDLNPACSLTYACYCSLYKYVTENFNVEKDVYVFGKSAGGLITAMLSQYRPFPIKAAAGLGPSLEIYTNLKILAYSYDINWWMNRLGVDDANIPGQHNWSDSQKADIASTWPKLVGHNPMWLGVVNVDFEQFAHELVYTGFSTTALRNNQTLQGLISNGYKDLNTPLKIWHAEDDSNVPYATSEMFVKMAKNAGSQCYLRTMPNGTGAHMAVDDISGTAIAREVTTPNGYTYTIPIAILEMVEWFNRW